LPAEERLARERAMAPLRLRSEVEQMRSSGASDREIFAYRERQVGAEAAERLAEVDLRRAQWSEHWQSYGPERARVLAGSSSLAAGTRDALLEPLRRRHFVGDELARARYLDQLELHTSE
jgi:lipase chaperone LimK